MFSLIDAGQLCLAILACGIIVLLPGLALAHVFRVTRAPGRPDVPIAVVVGLAVLPLLDSLATRLIDLDAALAMTLVLGLLGIGFGMRFGGVPRISVPSVLAIAVWFVLVAFEWIDFDVAGRLFQPFPVIDAVKHAATAQAILDSGAPPRDAFFLRPEHASYYYFFYTVPALATRLCGGLIEARAAVGGMVFWTGIGLYGLIRLAIARAGLEPDDKAGLPGVVLAILLAGGLDIIAALRMGLLQGMWLADPIWWNEQIAGWLESLFWVPHHVTGLIAGMVALMSLTDAVKADVDHRGKAGAIGLASLCCASTLGLSVWLSLGLVTTIAIWSIGLLVARRWRALAIVAAVGLLALAAALPEIVDLWAGRAPGPFPIVPAVRAFTPTDAIFATPPWRDIARFFALPLNYFAGFGVLASGTILFWTRRRMAPWTDFGTILAIAAVAGLVLGAFLKSTIFNNDLGWRVVLYPSFAGTVWTIVVVERLVARARHAGAPAWRAIPGFLLLLLGLGWSTSLYALVSLRTYPLTATEPALAFMSADPETERALRVAYDWANHHLSQSAVLQHDPTRSRAFAFGLYSHNRTAVSDSFGALYGADPAKVDARIAALAPIFRVALPASSVRMTAEANGIDDIVVTRDDPVWAKRGSFVWNAVPAYASASVRIIPVGALGAAPNATLSAR